MTERYAVIVMTRAPLAGKTKTRLSPELRPEQCAAFHESLLSDLADTCRALADEADTIVAFAHREGYDLVREAFGAASLYLAQPEGGLGARMLACAQDVVARGYNRCVMVGADAPELSAADIRRAAALLDEHDVVLGPASDGGFYLVAFSAVPAEAFALPSYGHARVLDEARAALAQAGRSVALLREVPDVDCFTDALRLLARAEKDAQLARKRAVRYLREVLL